MAENFCLVSDHEHIWNFIYFLGNLHKNQIELLLQITLFFFNSIAPAHQHDTKPTSYLKLNNSFSV